MKREEMIIGGLYQVVGYSDKPYYREGDLCRWKGNCFCDFKSLGNKGERRDKDCLENPYNEEPRGVYGDGVWCVNPKHLVPVAFAAQPTAEKCEWRFNRYLDNGKDEWAASCGIETDLPSGSQPCKHLHWTYCPFCGREIRDLTVDC